MASRLLTYVSGRWVPKLDATVSASDASFLFGFGIHDSARTYNGALHTAKLEEHVDRFVDGDRNARIRRRHDKPPHRLPWRHERGTSAPHTTRLQQSDRASTQPHPPACQHPPPPPPGRPPLRSQSHVECSSPVARCFCPSGAMAGRAHATLRLTSNTSLDVVWGWGAFADYAPKAPETVAVLLPGSVLHSGRRVHMGRSAPCILLHTLALHVTATRVAQVKEHPVFEKAAVAHCWATDADADARTVRKTRTWLQAQPGKAEADDISKKDYVLCRGAAGATAGAKNCTPFRHHDTW